MKTFDKALLASILLFAALLRFYQFSEIPFTHDEFSAIFRVGFDSFSELITKGVKTTDTHPAGVQVYLYYWTILFGTNEWVVKLPFALLGTASVFLIFDIAKLWFNKTTGFISAAFLASLQFSIMYSQIARPYISGMFFALLTVVFWSRLIKTSESNFNRNAIGFVLGATLCAYNHHFSFLFALIVGIAGLFLVDKKQLKKYALLGLIVAFLYLPHLEIFLFQLNKGGIGEWLAKPEFNFLLNFLKYIFQYSWWVYALVFALMLLGVWKRSFATDHLKKVFLFSSLFLLPFFIGFFYSIQFQPVLQFSVLIFSFPFLFLILFGHIKELKPIYNAILVVAILGVNTIVLIKHRQHYDILYNSAFEMIVLDHAEVQNQYSNVVSLIESNQRISRYYLDRHTIDSNFVWYNSFEDVNAFVKFIKSSNQDYLYLGAAAHIHSEVVPIIQKYYPKLVWQKNYFLGSTYLFSKEETDHLPNSFSLFEKEDSPPFNWSESEMKRIYSDSVSGKNYYRMTSEMDWSPGFSFQLNDLREQQNDYIDIELEAKMNSSYEDVLLVTSAERNGENVFWGSIPLNKFKPDSLNRLKIYHALKLADMPFKKDNLKLTITIWNKSKSEFDIEKFEVRQRNGNPIIYGLYEPIVN